MIELLDPLWKEQQLLLSVSWRPHMKWLPKPKCTIHKIWEWEPTWIAKYFKRRVGPELAGADLVMSEAKHLGEGQVHRKRPRMNHCSNTDYIRHRWVDCILCPRWIISRLCMQLCVQKASCATNTPFSTKHLHLPLIQSTAGFFKKP